MECPFHDAKEISRSIRVTSVDIRKDYGEVRKITIGSIGNTVCVVVYTERNGKIRIISARKANSRERGKYSECIERRTNEKTQ